MAKVLGRSLSRDTQMKFVGLCKAIQDRQYKNTEYIDRLRAIDEAYAKQKIEIETGRENCTTDSISELIKVPIVCSEVDTISSELKATFAAVDPLFGVLSERGNPEAAMAFQALISRDARYQRWARQIALFCSNAARYNVAGIEADKIWQRDMNLSSDADTTAPKFEAVINQVTSLKALDQYNSIFDYRINPADIAAEGEYAGYNELYTRSRLKILGNSLSEKEAVYNPTEAYNSVIGSASQYWNIRPDISSTPAITAEDTDGWLNWLGIIDDTQKLKMVSDSYLVTKLYVRIIPSEFGISSSAKPIIVQLRIVNNEWLFSYKEVVTPLDFLPVLFCDLREDGFGFQTSSVGENVKPYQDIATTLLDIRLQGSKRALDDRAIYDGDYLHDTDVNSSIPTAKMKMRKSLRNSGDQRPINSIYYSIPFDASGTISAMQDMSTILSIKDEVNGTNFARRGEQRPGNRTLGEFDQLNSAGNSKTIPYTLNIEEQVMVPLKLIIKSYVLSVTNATDIVYEANTETSMEVNIAELRQAMLEYRVTDGLKSKSLLRDPNLLSTMFQAVQNSPELNTEYSVSGILGELMAVAADVDISKYKRKQEVLPNEGNNPGGPPPPVQPPTADQGDQGAN